MLLPAHKFYSRSSKAYDCTATNQHLASRGLLPAPELDLRWLQRWLRWLADKRLIPAPQALP